MSHSYPKISIITPTYNSGSFLEATIRSILDQNYPNLEYIIIDGGSQDKTVDIIKQYEDHLHYWVSEPDNGMYDALQKGFDRSTGDIMAWLNSDDLYVPWTLSTVAEIFTDLPQVQWLTALHLLFTNAAGRPTSNAVVGGYSRRGLYHREHTPISNDQYSEEFIQQESTFWRRDLWSVTNGLDTTLNYAGEVDLWLEFSKQAKLYGVPIPLAMFRVHDQQITSASTVAYYQELEQVLNNRDIPTQPFYYRFLRGYVSKLFPRKLRRVGTWIGALNEAWECRYDQQTGQWQLRKTYY